MANVLVDTSVMVDFLRRKDSAQSPYIVLLEQGNEPCISIVTHTELFSGNSVWEHDYMLHTVQELCKNITIFPLDTALSEQSGKLRARYDLDFADAIIAATALKHSLPLATLNASDFRRVPDLKLFRM
ncbi:MAG: type II toxin-antitoxin system VapC family toxin [Patescibacteria group bacterium]